MKVPKKRIRPSTGKPVGHPHGFKPEYCEMLIKHMKNGDSFEAFGSKIDVSYPCLRTWVDPNHDSFVPEFLSAKEMGLTHLLAYDEAEYKKGMLGKMKVTTEVANLNGIRTIRVPAKFNAAMSIFKMKNRHHTIYRDRVENVNVDEDGKVIEPKSTVVLNILDNGRDKKKD